MNINIAVDHQASKSWGLVIGHPRFLGKLENYQFP